MSLDTARSRAGAPGAVTSSMAICAALLCVLALLLSGCARESTGHDEAPASGQSRLVLYSSLPHERVLAVAEAYRAESGTAVDFLIEPANVLIDALAANANYPPADVLLVRYSSHLIDALEEDVLRPTDVAGSGYKSGHAPNDPDGYWYGVGMSADVFVASGDSDLLQSASDYASLAGTAFKDRLCMRRGADARSVALIGMLIAAVGEREAELIVRGWRGNLGRGNFDTDAELLAALEDGSCGIAVADSAELAAHLERRPDSELQVSFPANANGGTLVHPTAAAVNRHAGDPAGAASFLAWLLSEDGQAALHGAGHEFPVNAAVTPPPLSDWLPFDAASISPSRAGFHHAQARQLIERARYR